MEELKQQIAAVMDKSFGRERHRLQRLMDELPKMTENELSRTRREMQRWQWEVGVRASIWEMVDRYRYETGELPYAILVGREAYGALYCDKDAMFRPDNGEFLWRGILVVRSTERNTAYLIGEAIPVQLPPCPDE